MAQTTTEIVVRSARGEMVARMNLEDEVLTGHCEWFNGWGDLVAYGFFKNGAPFTGTFLNWTRFFRHLPKENPYDATLYCQDFVTMFESSFASVPPKYELVIETYSSGRRVPAPSLGNV